ncbi:hypothetical protein NDU88_006304 [Pleurodeles waltl]|uniref:Uncharacterized protein n=1 Tax=Pleurodeles waltl TaxID=8319 RepID=A0AAV7VLJ1_PLEWA|nr:hypothetical protein NDU88_006304 [Pleurodeles waltl]
MSGGGLRGSSRHAANERRNLSGEGDGRSCKESSASMEGARGMERPSTSTVQCSFFEVYQCGSPQHVCQAEVVTKDIETLEHGEIEEKAPARFVDYEGEPAPKQKPQTKARVTTSSKLDNDLQEMLMAARHLVAKKGKALVDAQVMEPAEQEQHTIRPRQPTRKPVWLCNGAPFVQGTGGLQPEQRPRRGTRWYRDQGVGTTRQDGRGPQKLHRVTATRRRSYEDGDTSEEDITIPGGTRHLLPILCRTQTWMESSRQPKTRSHVRSTKGTVSQAWVFLRAIRNLGTQVGMVNTMQQGPQADSASQNPAASHQAGPWPGGWAPWAGQTQPSHA